MVTHRARLGETLPAQFRAADFNPRRVIQIERTHRHVEAVAAEIAHRSIAKVIPSPPIHRMIGVGLEGPHGGGSQPEVPVQIVRHRVAALGPRHTARPSVLRVPHMDLRDGSKEIGRNQLHAPSQVRRGTALVSRLRDDFGSFGKLPQLPGLGDRMREWFLAIHVLPRLHGRPADGSVPVVGSGNDHGIDRFFLLKQYAVILIQRRLGRAITVPFL